MKARNDAEVAPTKASIVAKYSYRVRLIATADKYSVKVTVTLVRDFLFFLCYMRGRQLFVGTWFRSLV